MLCAESWYVQDICLINSVQGQTLYMQGNPGRQIDLAKKIAEEFTIFVTKIFVSKNYLN